MSPNENLDPDEAFALEAYAVLPHAQPSDVLDARIRAAAHAANAPASRRRPARWTASLATAAVAVLAVGLAWRGMDSQRRPDIEGAAPAARPSMQPAFKMESADEGARSTSRPSAMSSEERQRAAAGGTTAAPSLSSADWQNAQTPESVPPPAARPSAKLDSKRVDAPRRREQASADPFPAATAAPPATVSEELVDQMAAPEPSPVIPDMVEMAPDRDRAAAPAPAPPPAAPPVPPAQAPPSGQNEGLRFKDNAAPVSVPPEPQAGSGSMGAVSASTPRSEARRAAAAETPEGEAMRLVSAPDIRGGAVSLPRAIAAARAARARGEVAETRLLVTAIQDRFGRQQLPADLRQFVPP